MVVDPTRLAQWCVSQLGSPPAEEIFRSGHLSEVIGLRLADGHEVVVKIRPNSPRIAGCVEVQRRLFQAGYPCPEPLTDTVAFGDPSTVATAESYLGGGSDRPIGADPAPAFARAFERLIRLAPRPGDVSTLAPPPSWADWNHGGSDRWPVPEDASVDLNSAGGAHWIDEAGDLARDRLRADESELIIGHSDWLAGNLRWAGDDLLVVHDWDSVIVEREAILVGFAAALYSPTDPEQLASVTGTQAFLDAYGSARGRDLSPDERQVAWAAGVWTRAYDAKFQHAVGASITSLSPTEADERLRRAGLRD